MEDVVDISKELQYEKVLFKYLGEHYGLLVFISSEGATFTATPNGDNSFLEIGKEYEMRATNVNTGEPLSFSFPFTSSGGLCE